MLFRGARGRSRNWPVPVPCLIVSKKKKQSPAQKMRARVERQVIANATQARIGDQELDDLIGEGAYAEAVEWAKRSGIPEAAIERYGEAHLWAAENPAKAEMLLGFDEAHWANMLTGIAYPDLLDMSASVRDGAWQLRTWAILSGFTFLYDWPRPVAEMTEDEIIAAIRQDARNGLIPDPRTRG